jgi:ParB family transcriptional regulator, chromosome partitioning protein
MALDLSDFENFSLSGLAVKPATLADGKPMLLPLDKIQEDPTQPRTVFDEEALNDLAASIKAKGVKVPISVKGPDENGMYTLNHGARRYRASLLAGKAVIPAFIDHEHDDFDQAAENIQRDNLTPFEIGVFVERKIGDGFSAKDIAVKLGKSDTFVSKHRTLAAMPKVLLEVYESGACRDVNTLYELTKATKKHAAAVDAFVAQGDLTRGAVAAFIAEKSSGRAVESARVPVSEVAPGRDPFTVEVVSGAPDSALVTLGTDDVPGESASAPAEKTSGAGSRAKIDDADRLKSPIIMVKHDGRPGRLLYKKRPAEVGFAWIKYDDDGQELEVIAESLELDSVIDG